MEIRKATQEDFLRVYRLTAVCLPDENYPEHIYKIILRYFGDYCLIAEEDGMLIGLIMGIVLPDSPRTYFLWQICVIPSHQGKGIGEKMVREIENQLRKQGFKRIELTIDPDNVESQKLFKKMGFKNISEKMGKTIIIDGKLAVKDYYKPGRHFIVCDKQINSN